MDLAGVRVHSDVLAWIKREEVGPMTAKSMLKRTHSCSRTYSTLHSKVANKLARLMVHNTSLSLSPSATLKNDLESRQRGQVKAKYRPA